MNTVRLGKLAELLSIFENARTVSNMHANATKFDFPRSIEIDCPPGGPRPGDLIGEIVKGTILEGLPAAHPDATVARFFGCWQWNFTANVSAEEWVEVQKIIEPRIRLLFAAGVIRYGSW